MAKWMKDHRCIGSCEDFGTKPKKGQGRRRRDACLDQQRGGGAAKGKGNLLWWFLIARPTNLNPSQLWWLAKMSQCDLWYHQAAVQGAWRKYHCVAYLNRAWVMQYLPGSRTEEERSWLFLPCLILLQWDSNNQHESVALFSIAFHFKCG